MVLVEIGARSAPAETIVAVVTEDVYSVMSDRETLGFVHKVGNVYVALGGDVLSHAVEVGQSLSLDRAIRMVRFQ
ncbi:MAG: hypothetical protein WDM88_00580 [Galbitalea sp.]